MKLFIGLLMILGCAQGDYGKGQEEKETGNSSECPDTYCPNIKCPDSTLTCTNDGDCPDCICDIPECPKCKDTLPSVDIFYVHDCECYDATATYACSNVVCARNVAESVKFGEITCDIMFSYYSASIGSCSCANLYYEVC